MWHFNENTRFSFKQMHLKMSYTKWRPFCSGLNMPQGHYRIRPLLSMSFLGSHNGKSCKVSPTTAYRSPSKRTYGVIMTLSLRHVSASWHLDEIVKILQMFVLKLFSCLESVWILMLFRETCRIHDDVIKRKYCSRYWPFVRGIHR